MRLMAFVLRTSLALELIVWTLSAVWLSFCVDIIWCKAPPVDLKVACTMTLILLFQFKQHLIDFEFVWILKVLRSTQVVFFFPSLLKVVFRKISNVKWKVHVWLKLKSIKPCKDLIAIETAPSDKGNQKLWIGKIADCDQRLLNLIGEFSIWPPTMSPVINQGKNKTIV